MEMNTTLHLWCGAAQDIADEAQGNVLIVTHGDAVNSSVTRLRPWAIVHPVHHTGFTAAYREEKEGESLVQQCFCGAGRTQCALTKKENSLDATHCRTLGTHSSA